MTRLLNWSLMRVSPLRKRTARVGSGAATLNGSVSVKYCQTTLSLASTSTMRALPESVRRVWPLSRRLAKARILSVPLAVNVLTMLSSRSTSRARLLFSSEISMWPFSSNSAEFGLLSWSDALVLEPGYCQTICFSKLTSIMRLLAWSVMRTWKLGRKVHCTGVFKRSGPEPLWPNWPYCQTTLPKGLTRMTRLSGAPPGLCGMTPAGVPVPAMSVNGPTRWASLTPMMELDEKSFGPSPNDQRMLPAVLISITRLLNWSAIRILPGRLNPGLRLKLWAGTLLGSSSPMAASTAQNALVKRLNLLFRQCGFL